MMKSFTYKSKYGTYPGCWFETGHYENGNLAVEIWSHEGCVTRVTVNPDKRIPTDYIAIKDYSENEGMADFLQEMNIIEEIPYNLIPSGFVTIPVHKLTSFGRYLFNVR